MLSLSSWTRGKRLDWPIIGWMVLVHALAVTALLMFSWTNFAIFFALYFVTGCLGITLGYHRLLTHRSFKVPKWLERVFAVCGCLALEGGPLQWCGHHRMHHAGSDRNHLDPHDSRRGFFYSHLGWMLLNHDDKEVYTRFVRDLAADPFYLWMEKPINQTLLQLMLAGVLLALGGWGAFFWGIWFRVVFVYHVTWLVNSASHLFGYRTFQTTDRSRNCWWVGLLAWGEGWHNNHHADEKVAAAGYRWWEIDVTYAVIRLLKSLGLAWDIVERPQPDVHETVSTVEPRLASQ